MKDNASILLAGNRVFLMPYLREHVETYHQWMQDEDLLRETGSERLTLDEEMENQVSWRDDESKCTFILGAKEILDANNPIGSMIGDINAFFLPDDELELSVMIAVREFRRKGLAIEAINLFMSYLSTIRHVSTWIAKINEDNVPSIRLFERIGFVQTGYSSIFEQVTLSLKEEDRQKDMSSLRTVPLS